MNGVRVLTVIYSKNAASGNRVRLLVTGACQNTQANYSLLSIYNRRSARLLFWRIWYCLYGLKTITWTFLGLWALFWYLTRQDWSSGSTTVVYNCLYIDDQKDMSTLPTKDDIQTFF